MRAYVLSRFMQYAGAAMAVVFLLAAVPMSVLAQSSGATIDLSDNSPPASGTGWTFASNIYTIEDGATVTVTGTSANQRRIEVAANAMADITLDNVSIAGLAMYQSPILLNSGATVNVTLTETNALTAGIDRAGIQVPNGTTLTINGTGSLMATGSAGGAGIGGGAFGAAGTITINGGTVTATSSLEAAGIGGGLNHAGGTVTISGGTVTATGGGDGQGIGRGSGSAAVGTLTMSGNAIVFANSVGDTEESRRTGGILFIGENATTRTGTVYGNVSLVENLTVPTGNTLIVPAGATLTVPASITLTNNGTIKVAKPVATDGQSFTYDNTKKTLAIDSVGISGIAAYVIADNEQTDAGNHNATATLNSGYEWLDGSDVHNIAWTIAPKPVTIIPNALSKTYGADDPALTYTTVPATLPASWNSASVVLTREPGENASTYGIAIDTDNSGANYAVTLSSTPVNFTIDKVTPSVPTSLTATYDQTLADVALPAGWAWDAALTTAVGNAGARAHKATFTPPNENYNAVTSVDVTITVNKATPDYTVPTALTATYGQTLANVTLPTGWSWDAALTTAVGDAGTMTHEATFTPADTDNYSVVTGVEVTITVGKATPDYTVPTALTATYGQTLADVALPTGWSWDAALTTAVGNAGTRTHEATFTPADTDNYSVVTGVEVTIAVAKADQTAPAAPTMASKTAASITLTAITGAEYSRDNGTTWQDSPTFSGLTSNTSYTFVARLKATDNHNASLASAPITTDAVMHTVTFTAPENGTLTVMNGTTAVTTGTQVPEGTILTITALADEGYELETLTVNSAAFVSGQTHTVTSATTIAATFKAIEVEPVTYAVTFTQPANGTLTVMNGTTAVTTGTQVPEGTVLTITALADEGYELETLTVNSAAFVSGQTHTVTSATTIAATFKAIVVQPPVIYAVTLSGASNGAGAGSYAVGATVIVSSGSAPAGMRFVTWTSNNTSVVFANAHAGKTSFTMPSGNVTVTATWEENAAMLKAGPNTLSKSARETKIYYEGESFKSATLNVYDAMGNVVRKLTVTDRSRDPGVSRVVGTWDLRDAQGRKVGEGAYLIRGVITTTDGVRVRVSEKVVVR